MKVNNEQGTVQGALSEDTDFRLSRDLDIDSIRSICIALGPYRNLTTLTAAVLFLHPNCQVLNHGLERMRGTEEIDFLSDYNKNKFDRFIQYAVQLSGAGQRGPLGGSVTHSHAFDPQYEMKAIFESTGLDLIKHEIKCLFWKDSLRVSNIIRERHIDLKDFFENDQRLRFLLPIRNPLDCAASNVKTDHTDAFQGLEKNASIYTVLQAIITEVFWFAELKSKYPDRFFYYFEHEISSDMLITMAKFMELDPSEEWISNALKATKIKPSYSHNYDLRSFYRNYLGEHGSQFPNLVRGLLKFS